jgi:uncharacterized membrane protein YfcA
MESGLIPEISLQVIIFFSSIILGMTGFGNALIALPLMLLFMDPKLAIPVMKAASLVSQLTMQAMGRFPINWRLLVRLAVPATVGTYLGVALLDISEPQFLIDVVAIIVLSFSLASLIFARGFRIDNALLAPMIGFVAGVLGGSVTLSGPPVVLFLSHEQSDDKLKFRGTLLAFFTIEIISTLISYLYFGLFRREHLILVIKITLVMVLGLWLGIQIFARFSNEVFRKAVLVSLVLLSLGIILTR